MAFPTELSDSYNFKDLSRIIRNEIWEMKLPKSENLEVLIIFNFPEIVKDEWLVYYGKYKTKENIKDTIDERIGKLIKMNESFEHFDILISIKN